MDRYKNGIQKTEEIRLVPGTTFALSQATTNEEDAFTDAELRIGDSASSQAVAADIYVHTNNLIYGFGEIELSSSLGIPVAEGGSIRLNSTEELQNFIFVNAVADETVILMVTLYFRKES